LLLHVVEIVLDGRDDGSPFGGKNRRNLGGWEDAGSKSIELIGFFAGGFDDLIEAGNGLPAALAPLIPLQILPSFGVAFLASRDPDMIADDPATALDHGGERPLAVHFDSFNDVDAISVLLRPGHVPNLVGNMTRK
jgi:hypothetical protein